MRRVGVLTIVAALAALPAAQAAAQGNAGFSVGDLVYAHSVVQGRTQDHGSPDSPFSQVSKEARGWIAAETKRQIDTPRTPDEVASSVDTALADDEMRLSKRYSIDPADITRAVTLLIMADAEDGASKLARQARKSGDPVVAQAAAEKAAHATANRKAAVKMQSEISMFLATL